MVSELILVTLIKFLRSSPANAQGLHVTGCRLSVQPREADHCSGKDVDFTWNGSGGPESAATSAWVSLHALRLRF